MRTPRPLVAVTAALLTACSGDRVAGPSASGPRAVLIDGVETEAIDLSYLCYNRFALSNANAVPVTVAWRLNTTTTEVPVTVPANGTVTIEAPFQQTMFVSYAGMVIEEETNPGHASCPVPGSGGGGGDDDYEAPAIELAYVCRNTFRIVNPNDEGLTLAWLLNTSTSGGDLTLAPHASAFIHAPFQQTLMVYHERHLIAEQTNPGDPTCATDGMIDVRPSDPLNNVSLKAMGVLPVAILTDDRLDAADVDVGSISAGGVDVARKPNGSHHAAYADVDGDGDADLLVHFRIGDLVAAGVVNAASASLTVTWAWAGGMLTSSDAIRIVGR